MTRTDAYDTMQRILNEFGPQETASIMASVLEKRSHSYMTMARESSGAHCRSIAVREAGRAARESKEIRRASLDLGGAWASARCAGWATRRREDAIQRAWEAWIANALYVDANGSLRSKSDRRVDKPATAAMKAVFGGYAPAFHDDAERWTSLHTTA